MGFEKWRMSIPMIRIGFLGKTGLDRSNPGISVSNATRKMPIGKIKRVCMQRSKYYN